MANIPHYTWSYSSLGLMDCPKKYELLRAKKVVVNDMPSPSADEGVRVHTLIENYINKDEWVDELKKYKRLLETYKAKAGIAEEGYAFKWVEYYDVEKHDTATTDDPDALATMEYLLDKAMQPYTMQRKLVRCEMDDPGVWYRGYLDWSKIDLEAEYAEVADWKTGKVKPSKQLQLYAWIIFTAHPQIQKVKSTFHWINFNDQLPQWFERKDMDKMFAPFQEILNRIDQCYATDTWIAVPGDLQKSTGRGANCRFCPVKQDHCEYGLPIFPEAA